MIENIEQLTQLGGTVVTVISFLYFMDKQNRIFNTTINNHLAHSNKVIDKNSSAMTKISNSLQQLCITMKKDNKGNQGNRGEQGDQGDQGEQGERGKTGLHG